MIFTLLAPEFVVGKALSELMSARHYKKEMQAFAATKSGWTLTHSFFANMGGFVLHFKPHDSDGAEEPQQGSHHGYSFSEEGTPDGPQPDQQYHHSQIQTIGQTHDTPDMQMDPIKDDPEKSLGDQGF